MSDQWTILFVDDEFRLLRSIERGMLDDPYRLLFAESGKDALKLLAENEVHVLVTDMRMPEMNGLELLKQVKKQYPRTVRIVLSGYTQAGTLLAAINQGEIFRFITKPWKMEEDFKPVLRQAIEHYQQEAQRDQVVAGLAGGPSGAGPESQTPGDT
jgi:two-component system, NtrC family, response regulator HupR/HoxA